MYKFGVKAMGLLSYAFFIVSGIGERLPEATFIIRALVYLPGSLWGGYLFGRVLAWSFKVSPDDRAV